MRSYEFKMTLSNQEEFSFIATMADFAKLIDCIEKDKNNEGRRKFVVIDQRFVRISSIISIKSTKEFIAEVYSDDEE